MSLPHKLISVLPLFAAQCQGCDSTSPAAEECPDYDASDNTTLEDPADAGPDLWLDVDGSLLERVRETSDEELLYDLLIAGTEARAAGLRLMLGLSTTAEGDLDLVLDGDVHDLRAELRDLGLSDRQRFSGSHLLLIADQDLEDEDGDGIAEATECPLILEGVVPAEVELIAGEGLKGGSCAVQSIAHSLYRKMGGLALPPEATLELDSAGQPVWPGALLQQIWEAADTGDDQLGLKLAELVRAHTARADGSSWNPDSTISRTGAEVLLNAEDDAALDCAQLQERCEQLQEAVDCGDDVILAMYGTITPLGATESSDFGHAVPLESAQWEEGPPCSCALTYGITSRGGPDAEHPLDNVPYLEQTLQLRVQTDDVLLTVPTASESEFPGTQLETLVWLRFHATPEE